MHVRIRPLADGDIDAHVAHLAREAGDAVALRFLEGLERTLGAVASEPAVGSPRHFDDPRLAGLRARPVAGFRRIVVFYLTLDTAVEVVRVLHGARDLAPLLDGS